MVWILLSTVTSGEKLLLFLDYIFCEDKEDKEDKPSGLTPMSMLPLIQFSFFQFAAAGSVEVLFQSGVVNFLTNELVHLNQLPSWKKVI